MYIVVKKHMITQVLIQAVSYLFSHWLTHCEDRANHHSPLLLKRLKDLIAVHGKTTSELQDITCHMVSHSVPFYQMQVNAPT